MNILVADFFKQVTMLYGTISDKCTDYSCPAMTAGTKFEYTWTENDQSVQCTAPVYIDYLFSSIQDELDDENVFPSQIGKKLSPGAWLSLLFNISGKAFPPNFIKIVQTIVKRLFRVYAHIYHEHFKLITDLKSTVHLNTSFKHFMLFVQEFKLMDPADLGPLYSLIQELIPSMISDYSINGASSSSNQS